MLKQVVLLSALSVLTVGQALACNEVVYEEAAQIAKKWVAQSSCREPLFGSDKEAKVAACMENVISNVSDNTIMAEVEGFRMQADPRFLSKDFQRFVIPELAKLGCSFIAKGFRLRSLYSPSTVGDLADQIYMSMGPGEASK